MGSVTEAELAKHGVTFEHVAGDVRPFGPADRLELRDKMKAEVERRTALMLELIEAAPKGRPVPLFVLITPAPTSRAGVCISCGDPLEKHRGGQCALCTLALRKALVASGRLDG